MTGFASAQSALELEPASVVRFAVELRSVNSRFLDLTLKLPDEMRQFEPDLRELLSQKLRRGKVEFRVNRELQVGAQVPQGPDELVLHQLNIVQSQVLAYFPQAQPLSVADVLRLSGAHGSINSALDMREASQLLALAAQALGQLVQSRQREGQRLVEALLTHLAQLRDLLGLAAPLVPKLVQQQRQRFLQRYRDALVLAQPELDQPAHDALPSAAQERAWSEATAFALRIDVAEELTRLHAHINETEHLLQSGGTIGKRLDFLIQEMHREANTLGSKSATLELTRLGMDMKIVAEQMREQVQNIE